MKRKEINLDEFDRAVVELAEKGLGICEFAKDWSMPYKDVRGYLEAKGLFEKWKKRRCWDRHPFQERVKRPYIDENVEDDLTLQEMADHEGISAEAVRQYLTRNGLYETWVENRTSWV
ncbi:MAG: hypothetical protein WC796_00155 [Candidatus Pacearchaeota archaeon]|jgi:hypothetical protein